MDRVTYYLRKAEECEASSALMSLYGQREQLLQMAEQWRMLARQAERRAAEEAARRGEDRA